MWFWRCWKVLSFLFFRKNKDNCKVHYIPFSAKPFFSLENRWERFLFWVKVKLFYNKGTRRISTRFGVTISSNNLIKNTRLLVFSNELLLKMFCINSTFSSKIFSKIILRPAFSLTRHICDVKKWKNLSYHKIIN